MENLNDLFTWGSLVSLQGSSAAALLLPNVLSSVFGAGIDKYKRYIAFAISMILPYIVAAMATDTGWVKWVVALFNGCLVYASAVGINQSLSGSSGATRGTTAVPAAPSRTTRGMTAAPTAPRKFFSSWL